MVLIKNPIKSVILPLVVGSLMILDGCEKDELAAPTRTDLLVGDWELMEWDGYDYYEPDFRYLFKFKSSGDFEYCVEYEDNSTYSPFKHCYSSHWQWVDNTETTLHIDHLEEWGSQFRLDIVVLDESKLEGFGTTDYDTNFSVKFRKVL